MRLLQSLAAIGLLSAISHISSAQLIDLNKTVKSAVKQQTQAQIQQRLQAQASQSAQLRINQQIQAQATSRIQAEANRAAAIAHSAMLASRNKANALRRQTPRNFKPQANANIRSSVELKTNQGTVRSANEANLGVYSALSIPKGLTETDVKIYDNIFGKFNPLRTQPRPAKQYLTNIDTGINVFGSANAQASFETQPQSRPRTRPTQSNPNRNDNQRTETATGRSNPQTQADVWSELDLAVRIQVAARQRRAEISELRDRALATSDLKLMKRADQLEMSVNAFTKAQIEMQEKLNGKSKAGTRVNSQSGIQSSLKK